MHVVVAADPDGGGTIRPVGGAPARAADLAAAVRDLEALAAQAPPRWVWADARRAYPPLLDRGVRLSRCHDLALTEGLLLAAEGRYGEPRQARAAYARLHGLPVPEDAHEPPEGAQATLFEPVTGAWWGGASGGVGAGPSGGVGAAARPGGAGSDGPEVAEADLVTEVFEDQRRRIARTADPGRFRLLVAAESAGALIAAEMAHDGMPWREDVHDALLTEMLGPRPAHGMRPVKLQALADEVAAAFGQPMNPDSPQQIVKAFKSAGISIPSTRSHVLKQVEHPAVGPLLAYKELARLYSFHGWVWADQWVKGDRFRPEYVVGGVVSGRWATSGGGALQIPKVMRRAVVADDGWTLVVADAAQLEPRVLAAMAGDGGLARAAGEIDLYAALAQSFGGSRDSAKIAMLSAMYGGTSGDAPKLLAVMRQRFPQAYAFVEDAARAGEEGRLVRSWLGRTCPPPSARWRELVSGPEGGGAARNRGRFTRNFVVQATAAEWALTLMAVLRGLLPGRARLVFFQHDEVMVHCPLELAPEVQAAVGRAAEEATRLLFGQTGVRFPMEAVPVTCYADAK
ncbi:bifunctional 3'-5' exonuclease/DNA polymerase [Planotetraspora sp. GP83]|uniref:bifunctional 3'-5' exonuclease/DNA polymerase n=1 Tax=Planotetraspora sp. GP83 TaxID=3156264 RepID=UPI0035188868